MRESVSDRGHRSLGDAGEEEQEVQGEGGDDEDVDDEDDSDDSSSIPSLAASSPSGSSMVPSSLFSGGYTTDDSMPDLVEDSDCDEVDDFVVGRFRGHVNKRTVKVPLLPFVTCCSSMAPCVSHGHCCLVCGDRVLPFWETHTSTS